MSRDTKHLSFLLFLVLLLQVCNLLATMAGMIEPSKEQPISTRTINNTPIFETAQARFTETMQVYETVVAKVTPFPTRTSTPIPTITKMSNTSNKQDGTWLVGTEVSTGKWRLISGGESCGAGSFDADGNVLEFEYGNGAIIDVSSKAYKVEFIGNDCTWSYIGE